MYTFSENRKCTEWPQTELDHITAKRRLYTLNTYPRGPNFGPFRSTTSRFRATRFSKNGSAPNDPKLNLNTWQSKVPCMHEILTPEAQILLRFALRPAVSKISHILSFPIDYHVKRPTKTKKICKKSKISNFTILLTTLLETFPRSIHEF